VFIYLWLFNDDVSFSISVPLNGRMIREERIGGGIEESYSDLI
jgi:hypothetical protein